MCALAASVKLYTKFPLQSLKFMAMKSCPLTMPFCMLLITAAAFTLASKHEKAHAARHTQGTVRWYRCVLRFMHTIYRREPSGEPPDTTWCCMDPHTLPQRPTLAYDSAEGVDTFQMFVTTQYPIYQQLLASTQGLPVSRCFMQTACTV